MASQCAEFARRYPSEFSKWIRKSGWKNEIEWASEQKHKWRGWHARPEQVAPAGNWRIWLLLAGRGFGKTRTCAEWVREEVAAGRRRRLALVAPTAADARDVMVEGESGLLNIFPDHERPEYEPSKRRVNFRNGALATLYSADEPERLRGPQHDGAWVDELCAWRRDREAFDMLMLGLRLGDNPQCVIGTTPKPTLLIKELVAREGRDVVISRGSTYDNADNLAAAFLENIRDRYEGTTLGRQELYAEILGDIEGALWQRLTIDEHRVAELPTGGLSRVVVGVDPSIGDSRKTKTDEAGIVVCGTDRERHGYVIDDVSLRALPDGWAREAVTAYHKHRANSIIAEANQGGEMVRLTIATVDPNVPVKLVHASRGKHIRAEPIAAFYEQGKVHHFGSFAKLEDEMCSWTPGSANSPNRIDACLVAGTIITTRRGGVPIESVRVSDEVMTRKGWRQVVTWARTSENARTIVVEFSNGAELRGTGNHPVWVDGKGFVDIDSLVHGDTVNVCKNIQTKSSSGELFSSATQGPSGERAGCIIRRRGAAGGGFSTERFGWRKMARSLMAGMCTTLTAILSTTGLRILSACRRGTMPAGTPGTASGQITWTRFGHSLLSGTGRKRGAGGTRSMVGASGWDEITRSSIARSAGGSSGPATLAVSLDSVGEIASQEKTGGLASTKSQLVARSVVPSSYEKSTETGRQHARVSVVRSYASGNAPVYNLEVDGEHEYYANGVLVHNCVHALTELMIKNRVPIVAPRGGTQLNRWAT